MVPRYDLEDRLIDFAVQVCLLAEKLPATALGKHVRVQLIRCGTSPFANYGEAQAAESRQDFLHKLKVCLKELRETLAWLKFAQRMSLGRDDLEKVRDECHQLVSIFVVSVRTAIGRK